MLFVSSFIFSIHVSFLSIDNILFFSLYFSFFYRSFLPHIDCFAAWTRQAKFSFELFLYRFILFHFFSHVVPFHPVPSINPSLDIAWRFLTAMHRTAPHRIVKHDAAVSSTIRSAVPYQTRSMH